MQKKSSSSSRRKNPPKGSRQSNGTGLPQVSLQPAPSALSASPTRVGMSDVLRHTVSWLIGYVYVGNGTLGATDSIYLTDPTGTDIIVPVASAGKGANVPMAPADALLGASYVTDVFKHFARLRLLRQHIDIFSLLPSTSNSMTVVIGPQRGPSNVGGAATDTTAALTYTEVISMAKATQVASWQNARLDMTEHIAGGAGARQNEFMTAGPATNDTGSFNYYNVQVIPSTFAISGTNSTTGLRGLKTHAVIGTWIVDLIDFIGGNANNVSEFSILCSCDGRRVRGAAALLREREERKTQECGEMISAQTALERKDEVKVLNKSPLREEGQTLIPVPLTRAPHEQKEPVELTVLQSRSGGYVRIEAAQHPANTPDPRANVAARDKDPPPSSSGWFRSS